MRICRKNCHGYENKTNDYNLIDINRYSKEELLKDDLVITKAMIIEKCNSNNELKQNLIKIIDKVVEEDALNKMQRIINIILRKKLGNKETDNLLNKISNKKKGVDYMLAVLERIEKEDRKIRENCRKEGIKEGIKEGMREGMNKGVSKARFEIAKEMIKQKIDINKICKCTKISKKEVEKIKEELKEA